MQVIAALMDCEPTDIWKAGPGLGILKRSRQLLQVHAGANLTALTDDSVLVPVLEQAGFSRVSFVPRLGKARTHVCDWLKPALQWAGETGLRGGMLFYNLKNPLLNEEALKQGVRDFEAAGGRAVVSVIPLSDHPCQFFIGFNILDMGLVHVFDKRRQLDGRFTTKPFVFDWASHCVLGYGAQEYIRKHGPLGIFYAPAKEALKTESLVLLAEGSDAARYSVLSSVCPEPLWAGWDPAGGSFRCQEQPPRASLWTDPQHNEMRLQLHHDPAWSYPMLLRLFMPATLRRVQRVYDYELCPDGGYFTVPDALARADCFAYALLKVCENEGCEFDEPYSLADDLWVHERDSGRTVNCSTGKEIAGRQGFPQVLGPDGSFFLIDAGRLGGFEDDLLNGRMIGCLLDEKASFQIQTQLDMLRLRVYGMEAACWKPGEEA